MNFLYLLKKSKFSQIQKINKEDSQTVETHRDAQNFTIPHKVSSSHLFLSNQHDKATEQINLFDST